MRVFVAWLLLAAPIQAAVHLPHVFSDNMILQRDKPVPVWGWAAPGETVTVHFAGQETTGKAAADGTWLLKLNSLPANAVPRELTVNEVTFTNVVVGDIWLCCGDLGVHYEVFGCTNAAQEIAKAGDPLLRLLKVGRKSSNTPVTDIDGNWQVCTPESVADFSGLGYFFGRAFRRETSVPVGLINSSYPYSYIHSWTAPEGFRLVPELKTLRDKMDSWDSTTAIGQQAFSATVAKIEQWLPAAQRAFDEHRPIPAQPLVPAETPARDADFRSVSEPSIIYNGMIYPLIPFGIRGAIWSLGENGGMELDKLRFYLRGLFEGWRARWGQGDFPCYSELIACAGTPTAAPNSGGMWAGMREQQIQALAITNTGLAVTFDVADYVADHRNRQDAGERLALCVLKNASGPTYREYRVEGDRVIVTFDHVGGGLTSTEPVQGFSIAGADKKWYWADANIVGGTVELRSDKVPVPVAIRYAYANYPTGNLYNRDGLPARPFRTDNW